jgi:hypothetical protein
MTMLSPGSTPEGILQTILHPIQEETGVLQELADVARNTRDLKVLTNGSALAPMLEKQAELCAEIERLRSKRNQRLGANQQEPQQVLPFLLTIAPKSQHDTIVNLFDQYVAAAESSQAEIRINKVVFDVTLSAVESALQEVARASNKSSARTYNASGKNASDFRALCVSTCS